MLKKMFLLIVAMGLLMSQVMAIDLISEGGVIDRDNDDFTWTLVMSEKSPDSESQTPQEYAFIWNSDIGDFSSSFVVISDFLVANQETIMVPDYGYLALRTPEGSLMLNTATVSGNYLKLYFDYNENREFIVSTNPIPGAQQIWPRWTEFEFVDIKTALPEDKMAWLYSNNGTVCWFGSSFYWESDYKQDYSLTGFQGEEFYLISAYSTEYDDLINFTDGVVSYRGIINYPEKTKSEKTLYHLPPSGYYIFYNMFGYIMLDGSTLRLSDYDDLEITCWIDKKRKKVIVTNNEYLAGLFYR